MIIPGPLFIVGALLAVAVILLLVRRWTGVAAFVATVTSSAVVVLLLVVPLDQVLHLPWFDVLLEAPLNVRGRFLVIEPVDVLPMVFMAATSALLSILTWRLMLRSSFFSVAMASLALLFVALMVGQVVFAALLIEMAALLMIFPLHEPVRMRDGTTYGGGVKGGLQYMVYTSLALPGLMIAQLLLAQYEVLPGERGLLQTATLLFVFSFGVLLGAVPFQAWLTTVTEDGSPPVVTFLFTVGLGAVWFLLLDYLESYTWLSEQAAFSTLLTGVGLLMMVFGGTLAAGQRRLGRIVGYATLADNGAMFVALGTRREAGVAVALLLLMARPFALGLMMLGLDGLRRLGRGDDDARRLRGGAWKMPWRALAFMMGGMALAGFPPSLGFAARWGLYRILMSQGTAQALLALLSGVGVMMGLVNAARLLLSRPQGSREIETQADDPLVLAFVVGLVVALTVLGLFPQFLSGFALDVAREFTFYQP